MPPLSYLTVTCSWDPSLKWLWHTRFWSSVRWYLYRRFHLLLHHCRRLLPGVLASSPAASNPPSSERPETSFFFFLNKGWNYCYFLKNIYLGALGLSCGMRDLVPWPEIEPGLPALGVWSFNCWTTKEVPREVFLKHKADSVPLLLNFSVTP